MADKYKVIEKPDVGRCAVAACDLAPGERVFDDTPFAFGPKADSPVVCLGCYAPYADPVEYTCSACGWPVCGVDCELVDAHRLNECGVFAAARVRYAPADDVAEPCPQFECVTPLRMLLAIERDRDRYERDVAPLECHLAERATRPIHAADEVNVVQFLLTRCRLADRFDAETIRRCCAQLDVNAYEAPTPTDQPIRCLYPRLAILSHACVSNIRHVIDMDSGYRVTIRAATALRAGDELLSSYTYAMWPTPVRRDVLRDAKYFECRCARCAARAALNRDRRRRVATRAGEPVEPPRHTRRASPVPISSAPSAFQSRIVFGPLDEKQNRQKIDVDKKKKTKTNSS